MINFFDWIFGNKAKKELRKQEGTLLSIDLILSTPLSPTRTLLEALWKAGAFKGVKDRHGKDATYESAVDGLMGRMTRTAIANAKKAGYNVNVNTGIVNITGPERPLIQETSHKGKGTGTKFGEKKPLKKGGLAAMREMTHAARTGGMSRLPISQFEPINEDNGHAIYLHYPNFIGHSKNALKIGETDLGEMIGDPKLSVGHAATILIDKNGNANYYEYGRYSGSDSHVIGKERRPTVKGGNWRLFRLPKLNSGENDSTYMARIQHLLPDTNTGAYLAMTIPSVDVTKASLYIKDQADDSNRSEYGIFNTCATGACKATLNFRANTLNNSKLTNNREGYSEEALKWSILPFTTDSYAKKARKASSKVFIMNKK